MSTTDNNIEIKEVKESSEDIYKNIQGLLFQLTSAEISFSITNLERIVASHNSFLFAAYDKNKIVAILTLVIIDIPTGMLARIEDVVVDKAARGKGIGEAITLAAIDKTKELGIGKIDLTSNPKRDGANRLYQKLGFKQRATNVYRFEV